MKIKAFRWVGISTAQFDQMSTFLVQNLGLHPATSGDDFLEVTTSGGDRLELNGPAAANPPWQFKPNALMIGFLVDDVHAARQELAGVAGVELLGTVQTQNGFVWQDFRAPDGNVYELTSDPKPEA